MPMTDKEYEVKIGLDFKAVIEEEYQRALKKLADNLEF